MSDKNKTASNSNGNLFQGEEINLSHHISAPNGSMEDEEINQRYIKGEVRIVTEQARYPLPSIVTMLNGDDYALNPEFQRRHRWENVQKSRLIESFIMNVPIPPIFLYEDRYSHYEVMDGLQRLSAIYEFYLDKYKLEGLEQWPELNGKRYSELPSQIKKGIDRRYLSSIILLQETAKDELEAKHLKQLVFERINSGGVKLEPQESRNAVFNGKLNTKCIILSRNPYLCKMWNIPEPTIEEIEDKIISQDLLDNNSFATMEDVELVLRFFANRQRENLLKSGIRFRDFLDNYLRIGNLFVEPVLHELENLFEEVIEFVYDIFGDKAFWLYRNRNNSWLWYQRSTTAVYDPLMLTASKYLHKRDEILKKKSDVEAIMINFYKENYSSFEGRNTNPSILKVREAKFEALFRTLAK